MCSKMISNCIKVYCGLTAAKHPESTTVWLYNSPGPSSSPIPNGQSVEVGVVEDRRSGWIPNVEASDLSGRFRRAYKYVEV